MMGSGSSSLRRGGHSRTTTPLWAVSAHGMDDLESPTTIPGAADFAIGREGEVGLSEHLSIMGNRLLHSRAYNSLYALLIALNMGALMVALTSSTNESSMLMVVLDLVITGSLLIEVAVRLLVQGRRRFWADRSNRVDCAVCALCLGTLIFYVFEGPSVSEKVEQVVTITVVVVRYVIQLMRLAVFVRSYKRTIPSAQTEINLAAVDEEAPLLPHEPIGLPAGGLHHISTGAESANGVDGSSSGRHQHHSLAMFTTSIPPSPVSAVGASAGDLDALNLGFAAAGHSHKDRISVGTPDAPWQ